MKTFARFFYSGFFSGYSPYAPGTFGSIVGFALFFAENFFFPGQAYWINAVICFVLIYPSIKLGDFAEKDLKAKDPQVVVLDEVFGYFVSVLFIPYSLKAAIAALILFRIFDILKPFPINRIQKLKGGMGIFMDDILAGVMSNLIIRIAIFAGLL
ncbi:MAG: phosphatidylglycerophosphatase A [Spirochaetes bacterium]|nr:phosphatidylglycerophosphatase A [Spirochaetota bacterium]